MSERLPNDIDNGDYTVIFEDGTISSDTDVYCDGVIGWLEEREDRTAELVSEIKHLVKALKVVYSFGATTPIIEHAEKLITSIEKSNGID